jgi:hypothetical protein
MATTYSSLARTFPIPGVASLPRTGPEIIAAVCDIDQEDPRSCVVSMSRSDALHCLLRTIAAAMDVDARSMYLLKDWCLIQPAEVQSAATQLEEFIDRIQNSPAYVLEATKARFKPETELFMVSDGARHSIGSAKVIYPENALIRNGWYYCYTEPDVDSALARSPSSCNRLPENDPDGEGIEYAFSFVKSHIALLNTARERMDGVLYAQLNAPGLE